VGGTWSLGNRSCYNPFEKLARGELPGAENLHLDTKTLWLKKLTISDHAIYDVAAWTKTERLAGNVLVAATPSMTPRISSELERFGLQLN
jgi:hypothetical protein